MQQITVSVKGQFNYRTIEISDKTFDNFSRGTSPLIKFNKELNRYEIEFENSDVFYQVLERRGL